MTMVKKSILMGLVVILSGLMLAGCKSEEEKSIEWLERVEREDATDEYVDIT